jgi:molybdate transport system permease protein
LSEFWGPLLLSLALAAATTVCLLMIGLPIAYYLAFGRGRLIPFWETVVTMPLVLPPTVIGYYLLVGLGPHHALGAWWQHMTGQTLPFSFAGLLIGSIIYSLPFAVQPFQTGLRNVDRRLLEAAATLGMGPWRCFWKVLVPLSLPSIGVGAVLSFAHTIGEFGVVLMIGGNIPGRTRVASIALFDQVQQLNYDVADHYAWVLLLLSALILSPLSILQRRVARR